MLRYTDSTNKFKELFDPNTGFYLRTGILSDGRDTGVDPFMRDFPALLDIGIMGRCSTVDTCQVGCYQQGKGNNLGQNMPLSMFKKIIDEISGKTFEIALGGFGNPNQHEDFEEIVRYARENGVVPNYTTSGLGLTNEEIAATKKYCGAVAVSEHNQPYTQDAIQRFVSAGVKTNLHYVLGNDSVDQAIMRLLTDDFQSGINAVIFLLYKPAGKVKSNNILQASDPRVQQFYELLDKEHPFKVGLDACHIPGVTNFSKNVSPISTTACDAARFSMYVTPDGMALPCSFDTTTRIWATDLKNSTVESVWNGSVFTKFREYHSNSCSGCSVRADCLGGCPLMGNQVNLCSKEERDYYVWENE